MCGSWKAAQRLGFGHETGKSHEPMALPGGPQRKRRTTIRRGEDYAKGLALARPENRRGRRVAVGVEDVVHVDEAARTAARSRTSASSIVAKQHRTPLRRTCRSEARARGLAALVDLGAEDLR